MSLYIKDMTLYEFAGRLNAEGIVLDTKNAFYTFYGHPIIDLPPHGRLIDADEMERFMSETVQGDIRSYPYSDTLWDTAFRWIDSRPTVIEAEE